MTSPTSPKVELLEPEDEDDRLRELINRAQSIIDENRRRRSRVQAAEIIQNSSVILTDNNVAEQTTRENSSQPQLPNTRYNDDEVIFVACEQNPVIDLSTPDTIESKRRRRLTKPLNTSDVEVVEVMTGLDSSNCNSGSSASKSTTSSCPICLDNYRKPTSTLCGHIFCEKCIKAAINSTNKCPMCKRKLSQKSIHPIYF